MTTTARCSTLVVWQGAPPGASELFLRKQSYMLQPVVRSLLAGLRFASNDSAHIVWGGGTGSALEQATRALGQGDLFIWVGIHKLSNRLDGGSSAADFAGDGMGMLKMLTQRRVHTVFYSTDAADAAAGSYRFCALNNRLVVNEIWEYAHATIAYCNRSRHGLAHHTRCARLEDLDGT